MNPELPRLTRYDEWRDHNALDHALFVKDFAVASWQVQGWTPLRERVFPAAKGPRHKVTYLSDKSTRTDRGITLATYECDSLVEAHRTLLELLGQLQMPVDKLAWSDAVGDVSFAVTDSSFVFARGNLVVQASRAEQAPVPVRDVAMALDRMLVSATPPSAPVLPTIGRVAFDVPDKTAAVARLDLDVSDPLGRPTWLRITAPGDIWSEGSRILVRAKGRGDQVEVTVFNENGGAAVTRAVLPV